MVRYVIGAAALLTTFLCACSGLSGDPRQRCLAIPLGSSIASFTTEAPGSPTSIGTVESHNSTGESKQLNCCARAGWPERCMGYGTPDAGELCPARAETVKLAAPYSANDCGDGKGGLFSCVAWVRDGGIVGVMSGCLQ